MPGWACWPCSVRAALYGFYLQNTEGLIVTGMTSQIHDGLYFANLVFLVGVAAGAVTIVFPAYIYHHKGMHEVTVLGEMLAIAAVLMVMICSCLPTWADPTACGT
jgi:Ni/Fe-hydrogenase subunit HybB-like protein